MSQLVSPALSLKNKKFQDIVDIDNQVLSKDYCFDTSEAWKFNAKTQKGSTVEYEAKFDAQKDLTVVMKDTLKLKFPFCENKWFWLGIRRNGDLKIHIDGGKVNVFGQSINLFTNLKTSTTFKQFAFRFGANYFGENHEYSARLGFGGCCDPHCINLSGKYLYKNGPFFAGLYSVLRLDKLIPCVYDGILGYSKENCKFYLQHLSSACDVKDCEAKKFHLKPGKLVFTHVHTRGKCAGGAEIKYDIKENKPCITLGGQYKKDDNNTLKAKLSCCLDFSFAYRHKFSDFLTAKTSLQLPFKKLFNCCSKKTTTEGCCKQEGAGCCSKDSKCCPLKCIPFGIEFELNL